MHTAIENASDRRPRLPAWAVVALLLLVTPVAWAAAQRRAYRPPPEIGLRGGYEFRSKDFSAGAQIRIPLARGSDLIPSGDWFFTGGTNFQVNLDLALPFMPGGGFYGGGGLGVAFTDLGVTSGLATTVGGNLFAGVAPYKDKKSGLHWFAEVRAFLRGGRNPLSFIIGLNTPLGR